MLLDSKAGFDVFDHGGEVGSSVGALVGEDQVLGLRELDSWTQSLYQLVEVLRVVVVSRVVQERAVLVEEVFFMLIGYECGSSERLLGNRIPSVETS